MTEEEARTWIADRHGAAGIGAMEQIVDLVVQENARQNLIAPSTLESIWTRHIVDSAQLLSHVDQAEDGLWIDIGSGAGFPGLVIAALRKQPIYLVEPRRKRADFLQDAANRLGLSAHVTVIADRIQAVTNASATIVSARAVAPITDLFAWAKGCSSKSTRWILPKGQSAREDVASARETWHGVFHVEHSITDAKSLIVLASKVARR
ncbi:16S rRNA (guanine(527)-N(7))-methyltransferase RsmG [Sphingomonas sp. MMS24-J45]|uniref:16S rRNA (guanine(527)-N(7))-methyltransferase RsmG n=1 Tax=Sphingomonas sp. MMS24-J45 TaxID=3238806 RepID=UPI00384AFBE0